MDQNTILDPAHDDNEPAAVAGIPSPDEKPETPDEIKVSEDGNVAEYKGRKYITHEALNNERVARQRAEKTLADLDPLLPEFQEFLNQKNARRGSTVERAHQSARPSDSDYSDEELEGFALTRGYYKEDNVTPDLNRAQRELDIITGINNRQVQRAVRPVAESTRAERARVNRERAQANKFVDGRPVAEQQYLDAAFSALGDDHISDPNVANLAQIVAAGLEYLDHRKNGRQTPTRSRGRSDEPNFYEGAPGRFDGDTGEMSGLDAAAARARGKTPEQWAKLSKQINKPTRGSSVLEEV